MSKKFTYRGKCATHGSYKTSFMLVPDFRAWLQGILLKHKNASMFVTIQVKGEPEPKTKPKKPKP